ncbi:hypothetical protein JAAARDRAFT_55245 [Jaapia argillacea MUCL 33604]|uniref:IMD domain-containing protein n=1 Tax=Jaapia argillacea MUCL 33604 TaxID=933084 RepID=A0A067Q4U2_9AGAM|nr:hypothetical protein JAAARDRAFT_55245 [Jaapia argillacea MUCL 33604]
MASIANPQVFSPALQHILDCHDAILGSLSDLSNRYHDMSIALVLLGLEEGIELSASISPFISAISSYSTSFAQLATDMKPLREHLEAVHTTDASLEYLRAHRNTLRTQVDASRTSRVDNPFERRAELERVVEEICDLSSKMIVGEARLADLKKAAIKKWISAHFDIFDVFSKVVTAVGCSVGSIPHRVEGSEKAALPLSQSATQSTKTLSSRPSGWRRLWRSASDYHGMHTKSPSAPPMLGHQDSASTHASIANVDFSDGMSGRTSTPPETGHHTSISDRRGASPVASSAPFSLDNSLACDRDDPSDTSPTEKQDGEPDDARSRMDDISSSASAKIKDNEPDDSRSGKGGISSPSPPAGVMVYASFRSLSTVTSVSLPPRDGDLHTMPSRAPVVLPPELACDRDDPSDTSPNEKRDGAEPDDTRSRMDDIPSPSPAENKDIEPNDTRLNNGGISPPSTPARDQVSSDLPLPPCAEKQGSEPGYARFRMDDAPSPSPPEPAEIKVIEPDDPPSTIPSPSAENEDREAGDARSRMNISSPSAPAENKDSDHGPDDARSRTKDVPSASEAHSSADNEDREPDDVRSSKGGISSPSTPVRDQVSSDLPL